MLEPFLEVPPVKNIGLALTGQRIIQVEEPDALVDIQVDAMGSALLGETFPVRLHLKSTGHAIHSGELQVSTSAGYDDKVQTPTTPSPSPSPVEAYIPARLQSEQISLWTLKNAIKVPRMEINGTWSTTVLLRWTEATPVSFFVSLRYQTKEQGEESGYELKVHRRMELQCQDALKVDCRYIAPHRRDSFLLSRMKQEAGTTGATKVVLPMNETSMLVVNLENTTSVPLRLLPVHLEEKNIKSCHVRKLGTEAAKAVTLLPEEVLNQVFEVVPTSESSSLDIGSLEIKWDRDAEFTGIKLEDVPLVSTIGEILTTCPDEEDGDVGRLETMVTCHVPLSAVMVEKAPLVMELKSPPYGVVGIPMVVSYGVQNRTNLLQEVNYSVVDAQGFLVSGSSRGSISLLPCSTGCLTLKLVPIVPGMMQLPQVLITALQYGASYQPHLSSANIFVFPAQPHRN